MGTSKYVTDYTGFSGDVELQSGNYLALKATADNGSVITAELVGGESGPVTLDSDGIIIFRLGDNTNEVKFVATKGGVTETKRINLDSLTKEAE